MDIERVEFIEKGIEAGNAACDSLLVEIRDVLKEPNSAMVNFFFVKLKLTIDGAYRSYFENIPESRELIEEDVRRRWPHLNMKGEEQ